MNQSEMEMIFLQMITASGSAKSYYMEALGEAKKGDYEQAKALISEGDKQAIEGHKVHSQLISREAGGDSVGTSMILMHAEDQAMSAEIIKIMVEEMIELYEKVDTCSK